MFIYYLKFLIVPELLLSTTAEGGGRVYVTEIDGTELKKLVDSSDVLSSIDTGQIYALEYNLEIGKIYFSDRRNLNFWRASLDNIIIAQDDREVQIYS